MISTCSEIHTKQINTICEQYEKFLNVKNRGTLCSIKIKGPEIFCPELKVTWRTVAIMIRVVLLSPYLCIRGVSLSSIYYNQSRRVYINQRHQCIRLIWVRTWIKQGH